MKMQNYTSYFDNSHNLPPDIIPISISPQQPKDWSGKQYPELFPTENILKEYKHNHNWPRFVDRYFDEVLQNLSPQDVYKDLMTLTNNKSFALCCFEPDPYDGHRCLVAQWLDENLGNQPNYKQIKEFGTDLTF